jgi:hypothetical protein
MVQNACLHHQDSHVSSRETVVLFGCNSTFSTTR